MLLKKHYLFFTYTPHITPKIINLIVFFLPSSHSQAQLCKFYYLNNELNSGIKAQIFITLDKVASI